MKISILMCGDKRDRTADLLNAIQALSQLSYIPVFSYVTKHLFPEIWTLNLFFLSILLQAKDCRIAGFLDSI